MEPDFNQMSREQLKGYVLTHRDSPEAVRALFERRAPDGKRYPLPRTPEELQQMEEIFRQRLGGRA
jgi:hypothetical protein